MLVYTNLASNPQKSRLYGDGVMGVKVGCSEKTAMQLKYNTKSADRVEHRTWIIPAALCVACLINDTRYRPE